MRRARHFTIVASGWRRWLRRRRRRSAMASRATRMPYHEDRERPRMLRFLALFISIILINLPVLAASGLDGRFYLSKASYSAGEPIYLIFEVKNSGTQPLRILTANPLSFCGGYKIEVEGSKKQESRGCFEGMAGSCVSSDEILKPGKTHTDRILLNQRYDLRKPGRYSLRVTHNLQYDSTIEISAVLTPSSPSESFDAQLEVVLEPTDEASLRLEFQKYVLELQSTDLMRQVIAGQVIANLAPPFLEGTIEQMLKSPELQGLGVLGLRNLGTPTSHRTLAEFVERSAPEQSSGAYQNAISYLGDIGDRSDLATLLGVAKANPPGSYSRELAVQAAGKVGGDDAVPPLVDQLSDPSIDVRQSAVRGLSYTGSRSAVPVLIELLASPEERVSGTAEFSLQTLTHYRASERNSGVTPAANYVRWSQWWNRYGQNATIYRYDECGDVAMLD